MKTYIGDGVYVEVDAWGAVILTAENGHTITDRIVLEPAVLTALLQRLATWKETNECHGD